MFDSDTATCMPLPCPIAWRSQHAFWPKDPNMLRNAFRIFIISGLMLSFFLNPGTEAQIIQNSQSTSPTSQVPTEKSASLETKNSALGPWLRLDLGAINVASADLLQSALSKVRSQQMSGLIIILDSPGGSLEITRKMVQSIMSAPVPVVVWVGPDGAHAGSAGAFITLAAHVAAMAPGTNIGAAAPVNSSGENLDNLSDLKIKIQNDTTAFMESIARQEVETLAWPVPS